jgi:hypothetical protein
MTMGTKPKRAKASATETSTTGGLVADGRQRQSGGSRRADPSPTHDPEVLSASLGDLKGTGFSIVAKGVVVKPPRPRLILEVKVEVPLDTPRW